MLETLVNVSCGEYDVYLEFINTLWAIIAGDTDVTARVLDIFIERWQSSEARYQPLFRLSPPGNMRSVTPEQPSADSTATSAADRAWGCPFQLH